MRRDWAWMGSCSPDKHRKWPVPEGVAQESHWIALSEAQGQEGGIQTGIVGLYGTAHIAWGACRAWAVDLGPYRVDGGADFATRNTAMPVGVPADHATRRISPIDASDLMSLLTGGTGETCLDVHTDFSTSLRLWTPSLAGKNIESGCFERGWAGEYLKKRKKRAWEYLHLLGHLPHVVQEGKGLLPVGQLGEVQLVPLPPRQGE